MQVNLWSTFICGFTLPQESSVTLHVVLLASRLCPFFRIQRSLGYASSSLQLKGLGTQIFQSDFSIQIVKQSLKCSFMHVTCLSLLFLLFYHRNNSNNNNSNNNKALYSSGWFLVAKGTLITPGLSDFCLFRTLLNLVNLTIRCMCISSNTTIY